MSDQCPSTVHGEKAKPGKAHLAAIRRSVGTVNGLPVWRSAEELADTPGFREHLEKEFPHGALEMQRAVEAGGESRRDFLKIMGGSLALAGIATIPGCRQPDHRILPYSKEIPEDVIIGKALYYATAMTRPDGGAEGLLVETHEGRPTKIEGNPLHPVNNGKASMWALASIMSLYDPDRLKHPSYAKADLGDGKIGAAAATWDDFRAWAASDFAAFAANGGEGLGFIVGKASSPALESAKAAVLKKYPKAAWAWWAPTEQLAAVEGARIAFGTPMREQLNISKETVNVIVSLDRDFLYHESDELTNARGFARSREVWATGDTMSRLYVIESAFSITGGQADHRVAVAPSRIAAVAVELAKAILPKLSDANSAALSSAIAKVNVPSGEDLSGANAGFIRAAAEDLMDAANREKALVLVGQGQPAALHALSYAMNAALGSLGKAQTFQPMTADEISNSMAQLAALTAKAQSGGIKTLVVVNANPVYDAPADVKFIDAWEKVASTVTLSVGQSETAAASTWSLNGAHYLESWGDARATDGTLSVVQPMIAPLYDPAGVKAILNEVELLTLIAGGDFNAKVDAYEIVRAAYVGRQGSGGESGWRRALHDGLVAGTTRKATAPAVKFADVGGAVSSLTIGAAPSQSSLDVTFTIGHLHDGRYANIAWLQELPEVATRTVWDNPALVSAKTAEKLGLAPVAFAEGKESNIYTSVKYPKAQLAELTLNGVKVTMPVWVCPGLPENTVVLTLGYGRNVSGRVADGVGVNLFGLRTSAACQAGLRIASGATLSGSQGTYMISSTQNNWSMEGRTAIVRAVDLPAWQQHGDETQKIVDRFYGTDASLNFAERLGELSHMPPKLSIYQNPYNKSYDAAKSDSAFGSGMQWAMTIDQSTCTGCGACTLACQSENNIPVVGKKEVAKGRELTWIRVDRYFTGEFDQPENMFHQPVACVHCENAPCEVVCPVNATVHGPEGLNYMTYNRCIGTRYCANNCPYKVRRYNFFEYGKLAFNGDYIGKDVVDAVGGLVPGQGVGPNGSAAHNRLNVNLVPPRLREKLTQIEQMQKNPNVTVRMRGVMEKCSYCVQRINEARIETKLQGLPGIPDGFFQAACQQACPSNAIIFGDMLDTKSRIHASRANARSYGLLAYLNTRPRTTHLVKVMNPNPVLCSESRKKMWADPFHHHHEDHDGHNEHHDSGHDDHGHAEKKQEAFFDKGRAREDRGYAMSLRVLDKSNG